MKVHVVYDADGTCDLVIKGRKISVQIVVGTTTALIKVYNKKGRMVRTYHFSKVYMIERIK